MRIDFVALAILCLALAPCVLGRSVTSTDSSPVDTRSNESDETLLHVGELADCGSSELGRRLEFHWSLKKGGSGGGGRSSSRSSGGGKSVQWPSWAPEWLWWTVVVIGCTIVVLVVLGVVYGLVTEKRYKDAPKWSVRTFSQRKLKPQYTIKLMQGRRTKTNVVDEQDEKSLKHNDVEKKVPAADATATDPLKLPAT